MVPSPFCRRSSPEVRGLGSFCATYVITACFHWTTHPRALVVNGMMHPIIGRLLPDTVRLWVSCYFRQFCHSAPETEPLVTVPHHHAMPLISSITTLKVRISSAGTNLPVCYLSASTYTRKSEPRLISWPSGSLQCSIGLTLSCPSSSLFTFRLG